MKLKSSGMKLKYFVAENECSLCMQARISDEVEER